MNSCNNYIFKASITIFIIVSLFVGILTFFSFPVKGMAKEIEEAQVIEESIPVYQEPYYKILYDNFNGNIKYIEYDSKEKIVAEQDEINNYIHTLYSIVYNEIGSVNFDSGMKIISPEVRRAQEIYNKYNEDYNFLVEQEIEAEKWTKRAEEYPTATTVWKHLTEEMGYNNYVAAGVIGNMMAECGGQTLNLNWSARDASGHYGLCQWSIGFKSVQGKDLQGQLDFMTNSFPKEIDRWGSICYKNNFNHEDFMAMEDASEVAYAFCVIYERPGPGTYNQRRQNALRAYEYFTS